MNPNIMTALQLIIDLTQIIQRAQQAGRDIAEKELADVMAGRDTARQRFLDMLPPHLKP